MIKTTVKEPLLPAPAEELKRITKEIADIQSRRQGLLNKQDKSRVDIIAREAALGAELLKGEITDNTIAFIAKEKALVEGRKTAIQQADAQLAELQELCKTNERYIAEAVYEGEVEEARKKFITCVSMLDKVSKTITPVQLVPPVGYITADNNLVKNMVEHLQQGFDIYRTLIEWERIAPSLMSEARTPQAVTQ